MITKEASKLPLTEAPQSLIGLTAEGETNRVRYPFHCKTLENPNLDELTTPGVYYAINHTENIAGSPSTGVWKYALVEVYRISGIFQRITSVTHGDTATRIKGTVNWNGWFLK